MSAHNDKANDAARAIEQNRLKVRQSILAGGLYAFVKFFWSTVEPCAPFVDGWHIELICAHLEAVSRGEIDNLIVNQPPGTSKSSVISVIYPVWDWLVFAPWDRFMVAGFDESLQTRDSEKSRNLVNSNLFRILFGDLCGHRPGSCSHPSVIHSRHDKSRDRSDTLGVWYNAAGGLRFSTTVQSKAVGWHAHKQIIDDPTKPQEVLGGSGADARNALNRAITWFSGTMATRKSDPKNFRRIVVMQRLHDGDLCGHLLRTQPGDWVYLFLPMEFDPDRAYKSRWGNDPRKERGELLCPGRFDAIAVAQLKRDMGPLLYQCQCNQVPTIPGGNIIKDEWLGEHEYSSLELERMGGQGVISWDCSFKDLASSDWVSGQVWYWLPSDDCFYLTDVRNGQWDILATMANIEAQCKAHPMLMKRLIEDKANGPAIITLLAGLGLEPVTPLGSKDARLMACTPAFASGRVKLRKGMPWTQRVKDELTRFPKFTTDDNVDAATQALGYFLQSQSATWVKYMGIQFKYGITH